MIFSCFLSILVFVLLIFKKVLYILDLSVLYLRYVTNIFSKIVGCLFFFSLVPHLRACGSQFPDQGLNSSPLQWKQSSNQWTTKEFLVVFLTFMFLFGCTGSQLQHTGSLIFAVACRIFQLQHANSSVPACGLQFTVQGLNSGPCIGSVESLPLDHQGSPIPGCLLTVCTFYYAAWNF